MDSRLRGNDTINHSPSVPPRLCVSHHTFFAFTIRFPIRNMDSRLRGNDKIYHPPSVPRWLPCLCLYLRVSPLTFFSFAIGFYIRDMDSRLRGNDRRFILPLCLCVSVVSFAVSPFSAPSASPREPSNDFLMRNWILYSRHGFPPARE